MDNEIKPTNYSKKKKIQNILIGNQYRIGAKIGSGSFGEIYIGRKKDEDIEVAIKLEPVKTKTPQLMGEARILKLMQGIVGMPKLHWQGLEGEVNVMVMELLGPSMEDLFNYCGRKFSLKTVLMIADQIISRIESLHTKNFIHRDIKPDNFLVGIRKKSNFVHLIDFGLAKKYKDPKSGQHIPYKENKNLTGTARYASLNAHLGVEQSRRDDLEAIGHVLLYFYKGYLPWQGIKAVNKQEKYHKIMEKKLTMPIEIMCKGCPTEMSTYLQYCRTLRFDERPDYSYVRKLFKDLFRRCSYKFDYYYDWVLLHFEMNENKTPTGGRDEKSVDQTKASENDLELTRNRESRDNIESGLDRTEIKHNIETDLLTGDAVSLDKEEAKNDQGNMSSLIKFRRDNSVDNGSNANDHSFATKTDVAKDASFNLDISNIEHAGETPAKKGLPNIILNKVENNNDGFYDDSNDSRDMIRDGGTPRKSGREKHSNGTKKQSGAREFALLEESREEAKSSQISQTDSDSSAASSGAIDNELNRRISGKKPSNITSTEESQETNRGQGQGHHGKTRNSYNQLEVSDDFEDQTPINNYVTPTNRAVGSVNPRELFRQKMKQ